MLSQPRGHVYRRNGVNSDDDSYQVDEYYGDLYDDWADGGYQEHDDDGHGDDGALPDDPRGNHPGNDAIEDDAPMDEVEADGEDQMSDDGDGNSRSGLVVGVSPIDDSLDSVEAGEDADNQAARVLFRHQDYDDLFDVDVPAEHQRLIMSALSAQGIAHPRPFQIEAIYHLGFNLRPITIVLSKTGSGKTAVPLTVGRLRRGVSLFMVPLIGLGCDLVEKYNNYHHDVEAYHLDEHREKGDVDALLLRLSTLTLHRTVYLFVSPQTLSSSSLWWKHLMKLSNAGLMALVCIDEAHEVAQSGRSFRPEFVEAVKCLNILVDASSRPLPRIIMSATMRNSDVDFLLSGNEVE